MKNNIAILVLMLSFGFSQTGMMTDSGMGVWLNASVMNLDSDVNDSLDPGYTLGFGYMTDKGIELSLDYWVDYHGADFNPMDFSVMYHMKKDDCNWKFGLRLADFTDSEDIDNTGNHLVVGAYNNNMMWLTIDHNLSYDDTLFDSPLVSGETAISFGKMWTMDTMSLGVSYTAGTDDLDMGWVGVTLGTTF